MPFASRAQQGFFFARARTSPTWRRRAKEWAKETDFERLPERKRPRFSMRRAVRQRR